jgi:VanZ family protein
MSLRRFTLWLPVVAYMAAIFYFSAQSNPLPEVTAHVWDKLLHTIEYAGLSVLLCRALTGEGADRAAAVVLAILLAGAYGATDEYHQSFVPFRNADFHDWIVDTIGSSLGAMAYVAQLSGASQDRQD